MQKRNLEIDRLRAIAVLITMYAHLNYVLLGGWQWYSDTQPLWNASIGVFMFFGISGYLISSTLLPDLDRSSNKGNALLRFWTRRFTRIMPLALLWISVTLACSLFFNSRGIFHKFEDNWPAAIAAALYHFNVYVSVAGSASAYGPYWSLSLEEQFYLVFPLLAFAVRGRLFRLVCLAAALVGMSFVPSAFSSLRMDGLIMGVMLFLIMPSAPRIAGRKSVPVVVGLAVTVLLVALLVAAPAIMQAAGLGRHLVVALGAISALFVYLALQERGFILPVGERTSRILDWIGTRSFGLYLIHLPAYMAAGEIAWRLPALDSIPGRAVLAAALLIVATELSYRFVEAPARRWGRSISWARPAKFVEDRQAA
jgi:peptidoglycan/LPS O-acetylase OafA/YrhL